MSSAPTGYEHSSAFKIHRALASVFTVAMPATSEQNDALYTEIDGLSVNTSYTNLLHAPVEGVPVNNNPAIHRILLRQGLGFISVHNEERQTVIALRADMFVNQGILGPLFEQAIERSKQTPQGRRSRHVALYIDKQLALPLAETTRPDIPEKIATLLDDLLLREA